MACVLTMGFTIILDEDVSKAMLVAMCEEMGAMLGEGNALRPLGGRKGLLSWWRWPGRVAGVGTVMNGKEMRLVVHPQSPPSAGAILFGVRAAFLVCDDDARWGRHDRVARGRERGDGDGGLAGGRQRGAAQGPVPDAAGVLRGRAAVAGVRAGRDPGGDGRGRLARDLGLGHPWREEPDEARARPEGLAVLLEGVRSVRLAWYKKPRAGARHNHVSL